MWDFSSHKIKYKIEVLISSIFNSNVKNGNDITLLLNYNKISMPFLFQKYVSNEQYFKAMNTFFIMKRFLKCLSSCFHLVPELCS